MSRRASPLVVATILAGSVSGRRWRTAAASSAGIPSSATARLSPKWSGSTSRPAASAASWMACRPAAGALVLVKLARRRADDHLPEVAVLLRWAWPAERPRQPARQSQRLISRHVRAQPGQQRVGGHVLLIEQPAHPRQRGHAAGPLVERRHLPRRQHRIAEVDIPVHAAAVRLVLRVAAPAERIVLNRGSLGPVLELARRAGESDAAGDPVRAVLGDLDGRLPGAIPVGLAAGFGAVDGVAQRSGGAVPHGADDLVHPAAAGGHERLLAGAEHGGEPVRAQARVLAYAAVIEDGQLLAGIGVTPVRDPLGVPGAGEAAAGVAAVTQRL